MYIYIYTVCAVILPIAKKKNISWGKENIVSCPPSLFMIPQRHNTCRATQEPAGTNHVHRTNSWSSISMHITWYTDVSKCIGREFSVCRNSVWNATYVKYQNSVGSWISTILDQREDLMSWPKYFVCSKERKPALQFNPLNAELNPICYLLALLGVHHFLHVSRIGVKSLTLRLLMSYIYIYIYIYGAPILHVSRSHTTTHHSR